VVVTSECVKHGFDEIGFPPERIQVGPYGGDFAGRGTSDGGSARPRQSVKSGPLRLLWVGQLTYRKGPHHLFDALRRLSPGRVMLTIVCRTRPDPVLVADVPAGVTFVGEVSDSELRALYAEHDVFVFPSLVERFGLGLPAAMPPGLPVLCTSNTAGPALIE